MPTVLAAEKPILLTEKEFFRAEAPLVTDARKGESSLRLAGMFLFATMGSPSLILWTTPDALSLTLRLSEGLSLLISWFMTEGLEPEPAAAAVEWNGNIIPSEKAASRIIAIGLLKRDICIRPPLRV